MAKIVNGHNHNWIYSIRKIDNENISVRMPNEYSFDAVINGSYRTGIIEDNLKDIYDIVLPGMIVNPFDYVDLTVDFIRVRDSYE